VAETASPSGETALDRVRSALSDAEDRLQSETLPDREKAESAVLQSIDDVQDYFRRATDESNRQAWMRYLRLEPLSKAIRQQASVAERGRAAVDLRQRLVAPEVGLELSSLVGLRNALRQYIAALQYGDPDRGLRLAKAQLERLRQIVQKDSLDSIRSLDAETTEKLKAIAASLEDAGQTPELVESLRAPFSRRNVHVFLTGKSITDAVARPVDETNPVDDCLLGTRLRGQSRLRGRVTASLLPAVGQVRLLVRLDGHFTSRTRGYNDPVTIDSVSRAQVYAARQVAILPGRMVAGEPVATANLSSEVQRINHPLKLVRHIARRQVAQSQPRAEAIAETRLRRRVRASFREGTDKAISRPRKGVEQRLSPWQRRLELPVPERSIGSTSELVYLHATVRRPEGFAAILEAPDLSAVSLAGRAGGLSPSDFVAAVQLHESVLAETLAGLLAGRGITPTDWKKIVGTVALRQLDSDTDQTVADSGTDSSEDESDDSADDPAFEIDFANFRPVFFEARDQTLRLGIRGTRFAEGERELDRTLQVTATYRPTTAQDGTMFLKRDELIDLSFPGSRRLSLTQTAIKANILSGFEKVFPDKLLHRSLPVPDALQLPALAGKKFRTIAIDLRDGWVTLAVR